MTELLERLRALAAVNDAAGRRTHPALLELRDGDGADTPRRIEGHAAVYNVWSQDLGGFKERILPGAFDKAIGSADVRALFNHDPNYILGRTTAGTLRLSDEKKGLHVSIDPPDTQTIRDLVIGPMERRELNQMSFSFMSRDEEWREPKAVGGLYERDLRDVELYDVSVVTFPAYTQTDVAVRSLLAGKVDQAALGALLSRRASGVPLTDNDRALIRALVESLQSELAGNGEEPSAPPAANGEEPSGRSAAAARWLRMAEAATRLSA